MITIKYGSVYGNYRWDATADITPEQAELLAPLGALQIQQRTPSTNAEKTMAGYTKRPKGFKRTDIPYSEEGAEVLRKAQSSIEITLEDETTVTIPAECVVTPWEGSTTEPKYKEEKEILARHTKVGDVEKWNETKIQYAGDGELTEENVEFLAAIKAFKIALLKDQ